MYTPSKISRPLFVEQLRRGVTLDELEVAVSDPKKVKYLNETLRRHGCVIFRDEEARKYTIWKG